MTVAAVAAVGAFGVMGITQIVNVPLAAAAVAGLTLLWSDRRRALGFLALAIMLAAAYVLGGAYLLAEAVMMVMLPAVTLALCIRFNRPAVFAVSAVLAPILALTIAYFAVVGDPEVYVGEMGAALQQDFLRVAQQLDQNLRLNLSADRMEQLSTGYLQAMRWMIRLMPAFLMLSFGIIALVGYRLVQFAFAREGNHYLRALPQFTMWKISEKLLPLLGLGLLLAVAGSGLWAAIGENAALFSAGVFALGGVSLVEYVLRKQGSPRALRWIVYIALAVFNLYSGVLLAVLGVADSHFDYRRVRAQRLG